MVFSVEIPLFLNDWGGMRYESGFLITEAGCEPLSQWSENYMKQL